MKPASEQFDFDVDVEICLTPELSYHDPRAEFRDTSRSIRASSQKEAEEIARKMEDVVCVYEAEPFDILADARKERAHDALIDALTAK